MGKIDEMLLKELGFSIAENNNWIRETDQGMEILVPQDNGTHIPYIRPNGFTSKKADKFYYPAIGVSGIIIIHEDDINSVFCKMWEQHIRIFGIDSNN